MTIESRVAVITGATGGLGRVVTRRLADEGARLALFGTDSARLDAFAAELQLPEDQWLARAVDLTSLDGAQAAADAVMAKFGRVDILLHLVGGWTGGKTVSQVPVEEMASMLHQHLWTTFYVSQAFVPRLVANGWGRIMAVSSPSASRPPAKSAPYATGKAAQEALLLTLAQELAGSGVTANLLVVRTSDAQHRRDREQTAETASWTTLVPMLLASVCIFGELVARSLGWLAQADLPSYTSAATTALHARHSGASWSNFRGNSETNWQSRRLTPIWNRTKRSVSEFSHFQRWMRKEPSSTRTMGWRTCESS